MPSSSESRASVSRSRKRRRPFEIKRSPMYMMSATKFLELYESGAKLLECHQVLKERGDLMLFNVSPLDDHSHEGVFIFVCHEWASYLHPDPRGYHTRILCRTLRQMYERRNRTFPIYHRAAILEKMIPGIGIVESAEKTWNFDLNKMWIWMDYMSINQNVPLPVSIDTAHKVNISAANMVSNIQELAAMNLATYIESADIVLLHTPEIPKSSMVKSHSLGRLEISQMTLIKRGWCVLELTASLLSIRKQQILFMSRSDGLPFCVSKYRVYESMKVGSCEFTCCATNHEFMDRVYVECDREIAFKVLNKMIDRKINYLWYHGLKHKARTYIANRKGYLDELQDTKSYQNDARYRDSMSLDDPLKHFMIQLKWEPKEDDPIAKETGVTCLKYAIVASNVEVVRRLVEMRVKEGLPIDDPIKCNTTQMYEELYVIGETNLHVAMYKGNAEVVQILLEGGANFTLRDKLKIDCMGYAARFGKLECMRTFLNFVEKKNNQKFDLNKYVASSTYLQLCLESSNISMKKTVACIEFLMSRGADFCQAYHAAGFTPLMALIQSTSRSVEMLNYVVQLLHKESGRSIVDIVNEKLQPRTMLWFFFRKYTNFCSIFKRIERYKDPALWFMKQMWGATPLHLACSSGASASIVTRLIELGADVNAKNEMGKTPMDFVRLFGNVDSISEILIET